VDKFKENEAQIQHLEIELEYKKKQHVENEKELRKEGNKLLTFKPKDV